MRQSPLHFLDGPVAGWLMAAAGASAVVFGAFGAHALRGALDADAMALWRTATEYHFWHALALGLALLAPAGSARRGSIAALAVGIVLFSGSLYALALGAPRWVGVITPLGGVSFIAGWILLGLALRRRGG